MSTDILADERGRLEQKTHGKGGIGGLFGFGVFDRSTVAVSEDALEDFAHGVLGNFRHEQDRLRAFEAGQPVAAVLD